MTSDEPPPTYLPTTPSRHSPAPWQYNYNVQALYNFPALGQEKGNRPEDKVQLACALKVKELDGGLMSVWNRRFCVLCGSRMFIFASSHPRGKPTLVLGLRGGTLEENKTKKYPFCLKVATSRSTVLLAFESRLDQATWLERAGNVNGLQSRSK